VIWLCWNIRIYLRGGFYFDDAFMFYRYAVNFHDGFGLVWNRGDDPAYGTTSLLWSFVVIGLSWPPLKASSLLALLSCLSGIASVGMLIYGVRALAGSGPLRSWINAAAFVLVPLGLGPHFKYHWTTGMDTMLAFFLLSGFVFLLLNFWRAPSRRLSMLIGALGYLAFLTRPDTGLCVMMMPILVWWQLGESRKTEWVMWMVLLPAALMALQLLLCWLYFGTALPLAFYMKSGGAYRGYLATADALRFLIDFLGLALPYLLICVICAHRRHLGMLVASLVPVASTFAYLLTVTQIMGKEARFYIPFLPLFVLPAASIFDGWLRDYRAKPGIGLARLAAVGMLTILVATDGFGYDIGKLYSRALKARPVAQPALVTAANVPLPQLDLWSVIYGLSDELVRKLPAGSVIGASEVGFIGATAPRITVVDLVGLNDSRIALQGFKTDYFFSRNIDFLWLPHTDYTGLRATLLSDPRFLDRYIMVDGMLNFGIAVRKNSPYRQELESALSRIWAHLYPGYRMRDFLVLEIASEMLPR